MINSIRNNWLLNLRGVLLAGMVVVLALIPEAIAFSVIAVVDPKVGLYASFCIAVVTAFVGSRPAMISAATAAMAVLMITLFKESADPNEKDRPESGRSRWRGRLLVLAAQGKDRAQGQQAGEGYHAPFGQGGDRGRCDLAGPGSICRNCSATRLGS